MTLLCKSLDYEPCPLDALPIVSVCADKCSLDNTCPISLSPCEKQCSDTSCAATEEVV